MPVLSRPSQTTKPLGEVRLVSVPAALDSPGQPGDEARDTDFVYKYVGDGVTHSWKRHSIAEWEP